MEPIRFFMTSYSTNQIRPSFEMIPYSLSLLFGTKLKPLAFKKDEMSQNQLFLVNVFFINLLTIPEKTEGLSTNNGVDCHLIG